ncbi:hemolysin-III related-domain-containing protein [Phanerochaete sordida]|uniref:Hemolysin-III related-domain-containing protein n=1 Tax=Phanerochaete sordida TaxID=48140 RepID=A0A9P3GRC0_9APHY|nr:hemolysin-III related-domain-containing protein [Phanerochaete sordida]
MPPAGPDPPSSLPPSSPSAPKHATAAPKGRRTIPFSELPAWRQENPDVRTGYRVTVDSWGECLATVGAWHNETVNIWTHLLGALAAAALAGYLTYWTLVGSGGHGAEPFARLAPFYGFPASLGWRDTAVFAVFFLGSVVCFACSTLFHTSLCHREEVVKITSRVDYLGILTLGTLNFCPTLYYGFYCTPRLAYVYMALMAASGTVGTFLVCAPRYNAPAHRRTRAATFVTLGAAALAPFVHALARLGAPEAARALALRLVGAELGAYLLGVVLYAERWPEAVWPGRFDFLGSSHQLFHVCSLVAVALHYVATVEAFRYRHFDRLGVCAM